MAGVIQKATAQSTVKSSGNSRITMQQYIKQMESEIKKALPSVITPERFTRIVLSALSRKSSTRTNHAAIIPGGHDDGCPAWR